ncbi:hypothetical protein Sta7437_1373 [Stanieria cyanosphaera PCC 7437]|uniref:Uncharacterized protein n=1 Tax=Stanieria cyanosphaera (strain ATCC 29371 / PCC 7437) TaxID=111780 RepID=K9XQP7_STAC7|nr:hypothetical protein [Stanieria cyanosphaera]AFZ34940.1 hypothetical protein Sta7437_1373 [Stanieria cyanosphaera PCC 7437]
MTDQNNRPVDFSKAKTPSSYIEREAHKEGTADAAQKEQEFTYEQQSENTVAHKQNITAHIPGGSTIVDVDK